MLNKNETARYNRHILLPEIALAGQEKLKQASVLVVGAGGLGCPVLQYLTAAGVGTIGIVDFDRVDESNLQRQVLYSSDEVGKSKVECAINRLSLQNPNVKFVSHFLQITNLNALDIIKSYDIVIDGTDNFQTRYLINDACVLLNKTLVYGSVYRFEGQVSVFNFSKENKDRGPNYRCLFPEPPSPETAPNCSQVGVLGVLPGIVGTLQANEVIKIVCGFGNVLSGQLLTFNALAMEFFIMEFERNNLISETTPTTIADFKKMDYGSLCNDISSRDIRDISSDALNELIENHNSSIQLLDVREVGELPFVEKLKELQIPLIDLVDNVDKIDRQKKVIVICKSGARSVIAIHLLQKKFNFDNLYSLKGGVVEFSKYYKA